MFSTATAVEYPKTQEVTMTSMFDYDDSINAAFNAKTAGKNIVLAKHEVLGKTGEFLFLAHSDREFALRCQMVEREIENAATLKMANVSDSKAKLVRALHEEWKLRHANCTACNEENELLREASLVKEALPAQHEYYQNETGPRAAEAETGRRWSLGLQSFMKLVGKAGFKGASAAGSMVKTLGARTKPDPTGGNYFAGRRLDQLAQTEEGRKELASAGGRWMVNHTTQAVPAQDADGNPITVNRTGITLTRIHGKYGESPVLTSRIGQIGSLEGWNDESSLGAETGKGKSTDFFRGDGFPLIYGQTISTTATKNPDYAKEGDVPLKFVPDFDEVANGNQGGGTMEATTAHPFSQSWLLPEEHSKAIDDLLAAHDDTYENGPNAEHLSEVGKVVRRNHFAKGLGEDREPGASALAEWRETPVGVGIGGTVFPCTEDRAFSEHDSSGPRRGSGTNYQNADSYVQSCQDTDGTGQAGCGKRHKVYLFGFGKSRGGRHYPSAENRVSRNIDGTTDSLIWSAQNLPDSRRTPVIDSSTGEQMTLPIGDHTDMFDTKGGKKSRFPLGADYWKSIEVGEGETPGVAWNRSRADLPRARGNSMLSGSSVMKFYNALRSFNDNPSLRGRKPIKSTEPKNKGVGKGNGRGTKRVNIEDEGGFGSWDDLGD